MSALCAFEADRDVLSACDQRWADPPPESGPAPAPCLPRCAWRAIYLPGSTLGAALRHRGRPPIPLIECCRMHPGRFLTGASRAKTAGDHSERCCGIPASRARTSVSRYRRCPPSVRIEVSLPAFAHRVTVLGSTRNIVATSAGVNSGSASGVRADMCCGLSSWTSVAILRCCTAWCSMGSESGMSKFGPTGTILPSPPVTRRPPGAKFLYRNAQFLRDRCHSP